MRIRKLLHTLASILISAFKKTALFVLFLLKFIIRVVRFLIIKWRGLKLVHILMRLLVILFFIIFGSLYITEKLTPSDYTIRFIRECDGEKCKKIKTIDPEAGITIENEVGSILSTLERIDFFARFTFLRFDFQTTNQSQFNLVVTEPPYEKKIDIFMQCNINGQDNIFSPGAGIIFTQKTSIKNIIKELDTIQDALTTCNPAPQSTGNMIEEPIEVAPNARVELRYNEEKYHLKFLPDKLNYPLTLLQVFVLTGIILGAYYEILRFIKKGIIRY